MSATVVEVDGGRTTVRSDHGLILRRRLTDPDLRLEPGAQGHGAPPRPDKT